VAPSPSTLDRTAGIRQAAVIVGTGFSGGLADGHAIPTAPEHRLFRKAVRGSRRTRIPSRRSLELRCFEGQGRSPEGRPLSLGWLEFRDRQDALRPKWHPQRCRPERACFRRRPQRRCRRNHDPHPQRCHPHPGENAQDFSTQQDCSAQQDCQGGRQARHCGQTRGQTRGHPRRGSRQQPQFRSWGRP
jgi:hypothetical protein